MVRRDETLLLDILLAARRIQKFTTGLKRDDFEAQEMVQSAVIREIPVIGEASRMLSDEIKTTHKSISWRAIIGMRNRVIHEYFDVDMNILWQTIQDDIPVLIPQLEAIIPPESDGG